MDESWIETAPALLAELDAELHCRSLSRGWSARLGSIAGSTLQDLIDVSGDDGLVPALQAVLDGGEAVRDRPVTLHADGGSVSGLLSAWGARSASGASLLRLTATTGTAVDVEAGLQSLRTTHELILGAAGEGIYGLDAQGRITFGNSATESILGWQPQDVLGRVSHEIHHHSHADGSHYPREDCPIYAALRDGEVHRVDHEVFFHIDGTAVPVEYTSTPILEDGDIRGAVVVFRDISERRALERAREAALRESRALREQLELERDYLRDELRVEQDFGEIIGASPALVRTMAQIDAVAVTPANVLILGESGVGKEKVAHAIHERSDRAARALIKVNCASIPKELFESEFFGHVKGAFTGAHRDRVGRLQLADGGTVFLDEVGEIPIDLQGKLLRALQEREFERVGDDRTVRVDVRVVAATNRDLEAEVAAGRFRQDLYYRLGVFPILVPPLRERREDIVPLAEHFLEQTCERFGRAPMRLSKRQAADLVAHEWPGNIRELRNVIERAVILASGSRPRLDLAMPRSEGPAPAIGPTGTAAAAPGDFVSDAELRAVERANLVAALEHAGWRVWGPEGAAALLGIKPSTLSYRMKAFGITRPDRGSGTE